MKAHYKIGMASKHSGVSPQTVRYYEKEDLFASEKDDIGATRYYNARHFKWLTNIRRYFKCGFSEQEVHRLVHCQTLAEMNGIIEAGIADTREELQLLRRRIEAMEMLSYNIKRIDALLGRCVLEENPSMTFLIVREGNQLIREEETERVLSKWLDRIELTCLGSIIPQSVLTQTPDSAFRLSGHCVPTARLFELGCSGTEPSLRTCAPARCIHTVCMLDGEDICPRTIMRHVYAYVSDLHLCIAGDAFGRVLAVLDESASKRESFPKATYYEYWIPVEEI